MKNILFVLFLSFTNLAMANLNADISCSGSENASSFQINTKTRGVWYNGVFEVGGPVFSGVSSTNNFAGEILGEIDLHGTGYYLTLIMRSIKGQPQLEVFWYPKNNQNEVVSYYLDDCRLN